MIYIIWNDFNKSVDVLTENGFYQINRLTTQRFDWEKPLKKSKQPHYIFKKLIKKIKETENANRN